MLVFFRHLSLVVVLLLLSSGGLLWVGYRHSVLTLRLHPIANQSLWRQVIEPQQPETATVLTMLQSDDSVEYRYFLDPADRYPYTHYSLEHVNAAGVPDTVDWRRYRRIQFVAACDPKNVLWLVFFTFDNRVTDLTDRSSRRVSSKAFSCDEVARVVTIEFKDIITPDWWLSRYGYDYSQGGFSLREIMAVGFVNSLQSPVGRDSTVRLRDIRLRGENPLALHSAAALTAVLWLLGLTYLVRSYIRLLTLELRTRLTQDKPFIAYKKLTLQPHKDKEKQLLLKYMATEYAKPDLSLESVAAHLGINRTKINELLKEEMGMTFSAYLNKLRLTEAARLLAEHSASSVSEVAYSVGYNNVSYFNKLFKKEYGCTPKTFQSLSS